jgi:6-phosphogluconate dehydrogenase
MPGGQPEAWELVKPIFEAISARVGDEPCVAYMGPRGAGHYVKMVHNGIEYGDMQLIAEAYDILHRGLGLDNDRLHECFAEWNRSELESYLIEITADILQDLILNRAAVADLILTRRKKGTANGRVKTRRSGRAHPNRQRGCGVAHPLGVQGRA